jgi:hypothetical protein
MVLPWLLTPLRHYAAFCTHPNSHIIVMYLGAMRLANYSRWGFRNAYPEKVAMAESSHGTQCRLLFDGVWWFKQ